MKNTLIALFATTIVSQAAVLTLNAAGGSFLNDAGVTVTYSFTSTGGIADQGSGDIDINAGTGTGSTTLMFSEAVILYISSTTGNYGNSADVYASSDQGPSTVTAGSTFSATEGSWSYDATGNVREIFEVITTDSTAELYGNRATLDGTSGVAAASNVAWGELTGTAVQTITWSASAAREAFNFSVDTAVVPEPSSAALLGLGGLALLARRKRA
ncbi:MAG: PEP-CTERM sorting domain-containing protein [Akkermansiaceae bacterium]